LGVAVLDGSASTSRETTRRSLSLGVLTGDLIKCHLPWLYDCYTGKLRKYAEELAEKRLFVSKDLIASMNVNVLQGIAAAYEWHVDSNPITGVLFVNTLAEADGGKLLFRTAEEEIAITPEKGMFVVFDARNVPHCVSPLSSDTVRVSVPMNYYDSPHDQIRPVDLDKYLYS
jgi:hypothetical protein